jgi:hypothetical protein
MAALASRGQERLDLPAEADGRGLHGARRSDDGGCPENASSQRRQRPPHRIPSARASAITKLSYRPRAAAVNERGAREGAPPAAAFWYPISYRRAGFPDPISYRCANLVEKIFRFFERKLLTRLGGRSTVRIGRCCLRDLEHR